jgi:hypothetical protein
VNAGVDFEFLVVRYWQIDVAISIGAQCAYERNAGSFAFDRDVRIIGGAAVRKNNLDRHLTEFAPYGCAEQTGMNDIEFFPTTVKRVDDVNHTGVIVGTNRRG